MLDAVVTRCEKPHKLGSRAGAEATTAHVDRPLNEELGGTFYQLVAEVHIRSLVHGGKQPFSALRLSDLSSEV